MYWFAPVVLALAVLGCVANAQLDDDIDCNIRKLAITFAQTIQPFRTPAELKMVADSLGAQEGPCTTNTWPAVAASHDVTKRSAAPHTYVLGHFETSLYVDYTKGDDSNQGTESTPLKTVAQAMRLVPGTPSPRVVVLRSGMHFVADTIKLTAEHSNTTITCYAGEEAVVSGALHLDSLSWEQVGPADQGVILRASIADAISKFKGRQSAVDFLELFYANTSRLVAARHPNGNPEKDNSNYGLAPTSTLPIRDFGTAQLVSNQTYNRGGMFPFYSVGVGGPGSNFDPPVSYWAQADPHGGGASTYVIPTGCVASTTGEAALGKLSGGGGFVFMMHPETWGSWVYELANATLSGSSLTLAFGRGGFQEARGNSQAGHFYISHRAELMDVAGEWYYDAAKQQLYVVVPANSTGPSELFAPVVDQLFVLEGSQADPVENVHIANITFRHAAPTFMHNHTAPSGGDYAVFKGGCVHFNGTRGCSVQQCLFDAVGGNAVWLSDYNRNASIANNEMRNIGENGVGLAGRTEWVDGRGGDQPRFNTITGNMIHHLGLYNKQACAIFHAVSCQNEVSKNILFHGPRALFNLNDEFGGATRVAQNLFFSAVLETQDHGPFNSWDRLPFLTDISQNGSSIVPVPTLLEQNFFFSGSEFSIDTDDGSNNIHAIRNIIVAQPLFKTDYDGHTKHFEGNVNINGGSCDCKAVSGDNTNVFTKNQCIGNGPAYPECPACTQPGVNCPVCAMNTYYVSGGDGKEVCGDGHIDAHSTTMPLPTWADVQALVKAALDF